MELWHDVDGRPHRLGGPALVLETGGKAWFRNGERHREGGPAIVFADGGEEWWLDGVRHRDDGPARIFVDGWEEYWLCGKRISLEEMRDRNLRLERDWRNTLLERLNEVILGMPGKVSF